MTVQRDEEHAPEPKLGHVVIGPGEGLLAGCLRWGLTMLLVPVAFGAGYLYAVLFQVDSRFDPNNSAQVVVAFSDRDRRVSASSPTLAGGSWTLEEVHARLDELTFNNFSLWSTAVLFKPYSSRDDFERAGVSSSIAGELAGWAQRDGGDHLAVFDSYRDRTCIAHVYLEVTNMAAPVIVFESKDPDR